MIKEIKMGNISQKFMINSIFHYRGSTWLNINDEILHRENINKLKGLI